MANFTSRRSPNPKNAEKMRESLMFRQKNLTSKIATAYKSMPIEQRGEVLPPAEEIHNPELDRAFDAILESNKAGPPAGAVLPFPHAPGTEHDAGADPELACPECGHPYLAGVKFCAMCGTLLEDGMARQQAPGHGAGLAATETTSTKSHHRRNYQERVNTFLLVAIVLLLSVMLWRQGLQHRAGETPRSAPGVPSPPAVTAPSPAPTSAAPEPALAVPVPDAPVASGRPAKVHKSLVATTNDDLEVVWRKKWQAPEQRVPPAEEATSTSGAESSLAEMVSLPPSMPAPAATLPHPAAPSGDNAADPAARASCEERHSPQPCALDPTWLNQRRVVWGKK